ncbi:MAG: hypothetical protein ACOYWZ_10590 [Bacillota bacterium]
MECTFEWEKPILENSKWVLMCGKVKHMAMEAERLKAGLDGRYDKNGYYFNLHSPKNPIDGSDAADRIGFIEILEK